MSTSTRVGSSRALSDEPASAPALDVELLESKLRPPWMRPGLVQRDALVQRLLASPAPIVAVVAPPGYGKTTLLGQWLARRPEPVAWVSVDQRDNDLSVLLSYLATALDRVEPIEPRVLQALRSPGTADLAVSVHRLAVVVSAMRTPFAMVIDHVEAIENQRCRDAIAEVVVSLPVGARIALASRTEPPIRIAQLRAQGRVEEVTAEDLAMDHTEARALLAAAGVDLNDAALDELVRGTEGWPVGLYLGALAIKGKGAIQVGVSIRGDDRAVADYLRAEVLSSLRPELASFLARTSVLEQLCGPLCDAVLGTTGSQGLLEALEASNLLLVPLDRQRRWYRYHHLFRDLLRDELGRTEPGLVHDLHDRAAAWFESQGRYDLAIDHAQAAEDSDRAARLFILAAQSAHAAGRLDTALGWLTWFEDRNLLEHNPELAVLAAIGEALTGRVAAAERLADVAVAAASDRRAADGSPIDSWISVMEAVLFRHGVAQLRVDAGQAVDRLTPRSRFRATALHCEALSYRFAGDATTADRLLAAAVESGLQLRTGPAVAMALGERAALAIERQEWAEAGRLVNEALAIVDEVGLAAYVQALIVYAAAARVAAHEGNIGLAKQYVVLASRLRAVASAALPMSAHMLNQLGHAYLELADPAGARAVLRQVRDIQRIRPDLGSIAADADELEHLLDAMQVNTIGASSVTAAELRLLPFLATHLSYAEIGERLYVSRNTVKSQAVSLFRKLGVSSRGEAVAKAAEIGLFGG